MWVVLSHQWCLGVEEEDDAADRSEPWERIARLFVERHSSVLFVEAVDLATLQTRPDELECQLTRVFPPPKDSIETPVCPRSLFFKTRLECGGGMGLGLTVVGGRRTIAEACRGRHQGHHRVS